MTLEPGSRIGKYVVQSKLAEGGMAEIFLCSVIGPEGFQKSVVLKRVRLPFLSDQTFIEMFIAEARIGARVDHPNVVQIFDFDRHGDSYFLAMEYVRGRSLWDVRLRAREVEPMTPRMVAHVGAQVACGLHYAHTLRDEDGPLKLVHRDVSPQNILCSFSGAVKLTDFGIAKAGEGRTAPGVLKGKVAYMSPEQSLGRPVDARSDVFALGIVLWELLVGSRLFQRGEDDMAVMHAVRNSYIPPPHEANTLVPPELGAIVMAALERDLDARLPSALELQRRLVEFGLASPGRFEDTDFAGYMRRLFPDEEAPGARPPALWTPPRVREPTADLGPKPDAGADDYDNADTHVTGRRASTSFGEVPAGPLAPPSAQPPPAVPPLAPAPAAPLAPVPARGRRFLLVGLVALASIVAIAVIGAIGLRAPSDAVRAAGAGPGPGVASDRGVLAVDPTSALKVAVPGVAGLSTASDAGREATRPEAGLAGARAPLSAPAVRQTGTLVLKATPWARVVIDGDEGRAFEVDEAPRRIRLPVGEHRIKFIHLKRTLEISVTVPADAEVWQTFNAEL